MNDCGSPGTLCARDHVAGPFHAVQGDRSGTCVDWQADHSWQADDPGSSRIVTVVDDRGGQQTMVNLADTHRPIRRHLPGTMAWRRVGPWAPDGMGRRSAIVRHDPGTYLPVWAEHYHGDLSEEGKRAMSNPALAAELTGKLLLIHGELDENVIPAPTLRLVDALITADADVDMLIVPGADHSMLLRMHYVTRRTWDYFVRHLHRTDPPAYRLQP